MGNNGEELSGERDFEKEAEEKRGKISFETEEALAGGRLLGALARGEPAAFDKLSFLASLTRRKKIEVVSRAIDLYYEYSMLSEVWRRIKRLEPEDLMAAWQLFRILMGISADTAIDVAKEFISGTIGTFQKMIEARQAEAYEAGASMAKKRVEEARYTRMLKFMEKLDPLLDMMTDMMASNMASMMGRKTGKKLNVPVTISEEDVEEEEGEEGEEEEVEVKGG